MLDRNSWTDRMVLVARRAVLSRQVDTGSLAPSFAGNSCSAWSSLFASISRFTASRWKFRLAPADKDAFDFLLVPRLV